MSFNVGNKPPDSQGLCDSSSPSVLKLKSILEELLLDLSFSQVFGELIAIIAAIF